MKRILILACMTICIQIQGAEQESQNLVLAMPEGILFARNIHPNTTKELLNSHLTDCGFCQSSVNDKRFVVKHGIPEEVFLCHILQKPRIPNTISYAWSCRLSDKGPLKLMADSIHPEFSTEEAIQEHIASCEKCTQNETHTYENYQKIKAIFATKPLLANKATPFEGCSILQAGAPTGAFVTWKSSSGDVTLKTYNARPEFANPQTLKEHIKDCEQCSEREIHIQKAYQGLTENDLSFMNLEKKAHFLDLVGSFNPEERKTLLFSSAFKFPLCDAAQMPPQED